ncbi:tetratricopeptide repeat protein [Acinetobacter baumannii]
MTEKRDRGQAYANLGQAQAALEDLEAYLALRPHAEDAPNLREMLPDLREALRKPS